MLKIYIYGYLNRIQSSRRLEAEANRNVELMWLVERLNPDFKTIARFRNENDHAIRKVCSQFVELCRRIHLFADAMKIRRCTIEHTFGTLKYWMGASLLDENQVACRYRDEFTCSAYNMKRVMSIMGSVALVKAMAT